jgi:Uma2 family endonuclease
MDETKQGALENGFIPPLEQGDRLTRAEFERRYDAMPHLKKAELIEGMVYMPSPVRVHRHGRPSRHFSTWLGTYESATPGVFGADNTTTRLDVDNDAQPDGVLFIDPQKGGQARISKDDYLERAPEWVGEIAASSVSYDLNTKLHVYRRNGVLECVVWRVLESAVDWFCLRDGQFERLPRGGDGLYRSQVFPGLWLDPDALVRFDLARVLAVVNEGVRSPEHAAFVAKLNP